MKTSCTTRVVNFVVAILLVAFTSLVAGIAPANAETVVSQGVTAVALPTGPGQGSMTLTSLSEGTITASIASGGTFAGGVLQTPVTVGAAATTLAYTCTGNSVAITFTLPGKGAGSSFSVIAPCGAVVVVPPAPVWNQTATIVPGPAGSGTANVEFKNVGSTAVGVFYITINDGPPTRFTSVGPGFIQPAVITATPGAVISIFGTQDGNGVPKLLATTPPGGLPSLPVPPAPVWAQTASIVPGPDGSGTADVLFDNTGSNQGGVFYVTIGGGAPTSATTVAAGESASIPLSGVAGVTVCAFGTKDGTATATPLGCKDIPAVPDPPAPVWVQEATITPGRVGSGNAEVLLINTGSNRDGVFFVTVDGGVRQYVTTVAAGGTAPIHLIGLAGAVIRVYGTEAGDTAPQLLVEDTIPTAPEPPAAVWDQDATISPVQDGSGDADVLFINTGSNRAGVFYVTVDGGEPTSATTVAAKQTASIHLSDVAGSRVCVFGTQDGSAEPNELKCVDVAALPEPTDTTEPTPDPSEDPTPVPSKDPVVSQPVVPAASQPVAPAKTSVVASASKTVKKQSTSTHSTWKRLNTFNTAVPVAPTQGTFLPLGALIGFLFAGVAAAYILFAAVRRHI